MFLSLLHHYYTYKNTSVPQVWSGNHPKNPFAKLLNDGSCQEDQAGRGLVKEQRGCQESQARQREGFRRLLPDDDGRDLQEPVGGCQGRERVHVQQEAGSTPHRKRRLYQARVQGHCLLDAQRPAGKHWLRF